MPERQRVPANWQRPGSPGNTMGLFLSLACPFCECQGFLSGSIFLPLPFAFHAVSTVELTLSASALAPGRAALSDHELCGHVRPPRPSGRRTPAGPRAC